MAQWKPDPTFYPSPRMAMEGPPEGLAYVATLNPNGNGRPDAMTGVDVNPESGSYGQIVGQTELPYAGDELHHFGWNACSSALCPYAPHPHIERRYLVVPGLRSSRLYILDTKPNPRVRSLQPDTHRIGPPGWHRAPHPKQPNVPLNGAPQMVEVSRDGRRIYFANSLYGAVDEQFYPDGIRSWMVKLNADPQGGVSIDRDFFVGFDGLRAHQVRLEGGDCSSDSFCYA